MPTRSNDRAARRDRDRYGSDPRTHREARPRRDPRDGAGGDVGSAAATLFRALLPLRLFLGVTFLYAGIDKLVDPAFLRDAGLGSIGEQLVGFVRVSPLAPFIEIFAQPMPVLVGVLIAVVEIGIGLGALTGLLYRASAAGGAALSLLFWLTASWATKPYYYGPDLPYALGWVTLALAGHGSLLVLDGRLVAWAGERLARARYGSPAPAGEVEAWTADPTRRGFLQLAALGAGALVVASAAGAVGRVRSMPSALGQGGGSDGSLGAGATATPSAGTVASPAPAASAPPPATQTSPSGQLVAKLDQLKPRQAIGFQDPTSGDPAVLIRLANGSVVAYDAVCTHAGCTVEYDASSGFLICPCHGATFDPGAHATPIAGPTDIPLATLPIKVDPSTGRITLAG